MKSCVPFFVWAFLVLGSWNYGSAWAQDVPPASATEALEHLADLVSRGKLGGANDDHPVSSMVIQVLSSSETEPLSAALAAFDTLARTEGILPALESAHAVAKAMQLAAGRGSDEAVVVCLSGRGDKDAAEIARLRGEEM